MLVRNLSISSVLLGLGLATGVMTKVRLGLVGISEILFLFFIIHSLSNFGQKLLVVEKSMHGYVLLYLKATTFILLPIVTFAVYFFSSFNSMPVYVVSYIMGVLILCLLVEEIKAGLDLKQVSIIFATGFIVINFIAILIFPKSVRFEGFASNPNQLTFYAMSLSLMMSIYLGKRAVFFFVPLVFIMLMTGSDTFLLSCFIVLFTYIAFSFLRFKKYSFISNLVFLLVPFFMLLYYILINYSETLIKIWSDADEGGTRLSLFENAFEVSYTSPLFGYGAGSFSGLTAPFQFSEAHNTFLDFSMQFGFLFPILLYGCFFAAFFRVLKDKHFLVAAFIISYIVSGLFHFAGRHFVFWVEASVFMSIAFGHYKIGERS